MLRFLHDGHHPTQRSHNKISENFWAYKISRKKNDFASTISKNLFKFH